MVERDEIFALRVEPSEESATVWASGELDLAANSALRQALREAAEFSPVVVLDLREVEFVDGSTLGAIVAAQKELPEEGRIVLRHPNRVVMRVLELTQLDKAFEIE